MIDISLGRKNVVSVEYTEQIITRDQVKKYLKITDTSYDADIDTYLVSTEQSTQYATNNSWDLETSSDTTIASTTIDIGTSVARYVQVDNLVKIESQGIERAVIVSIDKSAGTIEIDTEATATEGGAEVIINTFPEGYKHIVSKMVAHNIGEASPTARTGELDSERIGSYSYSRGDGGQIKDGYPAALVDSLAPIKRPRFK